MPLKRNGTAMDQDLLDLYAAPAEVIWLGCYRADLYCRPKDGSISPRDERRPSIA